MIEVPVPLEEPLTEGEVEADAVQANVAPAGVLVKFNAVVFPEQMEVGPVIETMGVGLTTRLV